MVDSHGGPSSRRPCRLPSWELRERLDGSQLSKAVIVNGRRQPAKPTRSWEGEMPLLWWDPCADARWFVGQPAVAADELSDQAQAMSFSLHQPNNHVPLLSTPPWRTIREFRARFLSFVCCVSRRCLSFSIPSCRSPCGGERH
jgi:hypothetical protein